jgi:trehalose 6-phosphate phosphatase
LDHLLAPWQVIGAGLHGAEFRWPGSTKIERAADGPVGPIVEQLRHRFSFEPAVEIEDKGVAVALHFRRAPEYASECAEAMSEITRARPNLRLLRGHFVIEALPTDANKGAAIARLMKTETFAGRVPTFVGDDVTDEDAFPTVGVLGGLCVKVGHRSSVATYGFDSPAEVLGWLRSSLSSLQSRNDDRTNS